MEPKTQVKDKIELDLVGTEQRSYPTLQEVACLHMENLGFVNSQIQRIPGKIATLQKNSAVLGVWAFGTDQILVQTVDEFYLEPR